MNTTLLEHTLAAMEAIMTGKPVDEPTLEGVRCYVPLRAGRPACNPAIVLYRSRGDSIELHSVNIPLPGITHTITADTMDSDTYEAVVDAVMGALNDLRSDSEVEGVEKFFPYTGGRFK